MLFLLLKLLILQLLACLLLLLDVLALLSLILELFILQMIHIKMNQYKRRGKMTRARRLK